MNGMKQGLIIGAVAGLFFGFVLGRFGLDQANKRSMSASSRGGFSKMSQLPRGTILPKDMKGINWKKLFGSKKARATYVLNKIPCKCKGVSRSMAYCLKNAKVCKPNMKVARAVVSQISDGVDYRRVLALYAPKGRRGSRRARRGRAPGDAKSATRTLVRVSNDDPSFGPKDALVTIVEFSDFQCPFCARGAKTIDQVKKYYKGKVRIVFKHLPLPFHKQAHIAAQASMAANAQGKFWEFHDKLFQNYRSINKANLVKWAKELGLDATKVKEALDKGTYKAKVNRDLRYSRSVGARGTPNFFINGRKIAGALPYGSFKAIIDQELTLAKQLIKQGTPRNKLMGKLMAFGRKAQLEKQRLLSNIPIGKSPTYGSSKAKVTVYEFSDFQCPFCSRAAKTIDQVKKAYGNKVRIVFKHNPLSFHNQAHLAAQASMAAHAQGKFWPYHDKLFANYRNLNKANMIKWAKELGLNVARFTKELNSGKYKGDVDADLALGRKIGVRGTPNFLINGARISGAQPFARFKAAIDRAMGRPSAPAPAARPSRVAARTNVSRTKITIGQAPVLGPKFAPVTIVEFSDFQCPFCNRGGATVKRLQKAYGKRVRVVFKHRPLSFHSNAKLAAQASMAAHAQGKFWEYHDKLFQNFRNLSKSNMLKWAKELGLDTSKFKAALDKGTYSAYVERDNKLAMAVGAGGTPTFFINGRKLVGAQPYNRFKAIVDQELALANQLMKKGTALSGLYEKILSTSKAPSVARRPRRAAPTVGKRTQIATAGAPSFGPKNAKVTIVEYSDFQCPFCSRGARTIERIKKAYKGKVRVVFKHRPLSFHRQANIAAQASMAAHAQGKFWQYHDKLFANSRNINKANLLKWAKELGLDVKKFHSALDSGKYKAYVSKDNAEAVRNGAGGTPTFFINGRKLVGAQPFFRFKAIIDQELSGKKLPQLRVVRPNRQRAPRVVAGSGRPIVPVGNSPTFGPANAKVTITEFSDFQCPFCSRGAKVVDQIKKAYKGKVRIVFKHRPLSFHRQANLAAQASMAAHAQGKFWQYHDKLFANSRNLNKANMIKWAKELGLDVARFTKELNSGKYSGHVDKDNATAMRVGARGTPTFFIGTQRLVGAQPFARFKAVIDKLLSGKAPAVAIRRRKPFVPRVVRAVKGDPNAAKRAVRSFVKVNDDDASFGPKNAPVTIVEFSDFQCPFCNRGAKVIDQVKKAFKGKVRIVFKHLPLPFHRQAHPAAQAALAAKAQGKFWEYHDKLFQNYRSINKANLIKWAKELGLDATKVKEALDKGTYKAQVDRDLRYSRSVGARGTPNFFINGRKVAGAYPFSHFQKIISQELAYAKQLRKQGVAEDKIYDKLMEAGKKAAIAENLRKMRAARARAKLLKNLPLAGSPTFGPKDAKVTILEFSDFQCPYCSRGARTIDQVKKAYKGKVRIVFKHLPLSFHRQAHIAAQASMEAHAQGKFWEYHDKLFANGRSINKDNLVKWAKELGLDAAKMKAALDSGKYKAYVDKDLALARRLQIRGTPNFLINGQKLVGAQPFPRFKAMIDRALGAPTAVPTARVVAPRPVAAKPVKITVGKAPVLGPKDAPVTIVEFSDFQCPFCNRAANTMRQLKKEYGDKVRLVFKHRPLSFHSNAKLAAQASMAAHAQGKFWKYHDKLFQNFRNLSKANMLKWAQELGLDVTRFKKELEGGAHKAIVEADNKLAVQVGAQGTPTFFINGKKVVGALPFSTFKGHVDAALKSAKKK